MRSRPQLQSTSIEIGLPDGLDLGEGQQEGVEHVGVEVGGAFLLDGLDGGFDGEGGAVDAVGGEGVEGVGDGPQMPWPGRNSFVKGGKPAFGSCAIRP
jgi:hypothetical protein